MLFLLSPAKSLDWESPLPPSIEATTPLFLEKSAILNRLLRQKTPQELAELMSISPKLAELNVQRFRDWSLPFTPQNARPCVFTFNGDVYEGLDAASLTDAQLHWAQEHLLILSGLYGVLRPMDLMQPYRLEMGTRLAVGEARNLYDFWQQTITDYIVGRLEVKKVPIVVNLASNEYFKAVQSRRLKARIIDCVFQDEKNGQFKIISFYAKHARGLMVRYAIENDLHTPDELSGFNLNGYRFAPDLSNDARLVFQRQEGDIPA